MEISTVTKHKITFTVELRDGLELNEQYGGTVDTIAKAAHLIELARAFRPGDWVIVGEVETRVEPTK